MDRGGSSVHQRQRSRGPWVAAFTALAIVLTGALAAGANAGKSHARACASIERLGLEKQMNAHAAQILAACGRAPAGSLTGGGFSALSALGKLAAPDSYGGPDSNLTAGDGTYPHVTQSETQAWAEGNTIVVAYNDSALAPSCYSGGSYSTDHGVTWNLLTTRPFCSGHGTGYGDPVVVYDQAHSKWIAVFIASGCGGGGLGAWMSVDGVAWTPGSCVHSGGGDDRESGWVDNSASSPHYGRMYISWNDFGQNQQIRVTYSDDGGATWSSPVNVNSTFVRNVQITTGPDGTVFIAGMNEGGGGLGSRTNIMYRSTNGGASWSPVTMGAAFPGPGQSTCGYFAAMFPSYWRHMGWGDVGAGPSGIIHYAYAQHGTGSDYGDVYYTRSSDNGLTWSSPLKLNTDGTTRSQWQPSLSVSPDGHVFVSWYDARATTGNNFERWGRLSTDNGSTWENDDVISDVPSPLPLQPDGSVQPCYTGDYDRSYGNDSAFYLPWVDGRVLINGNSQQDVFFDKQTVGPPPPPAPNLVHDLATLYDDNGNGYIEPGESFELDERVRNAGNAAATNISGVLSSTNPDITINQPNSAYPDIPPSGNGTNNTRFAGQASNSLGCGDPIAFRVTLTTAQGNFNVNFTVPTVPCDYIITTQTGQPIIPGTLDIGNHCDDCATPVTFPFPVTLYGQTYTSGNVISNGNLQIGSEAFDWTKSGHSCPTGTTCVPTRATAASSRRLSAARRTGSSWSSGARPTTLRAGRPTSSSSSPRGRASSASVTA